MRHLPGAFALSAAIALAAYSAAACSGPGQQAAARTAASRASIPVRPGNASSLRVGDRLKVSVPAGAVTGHGILTASITTAPASAPQGLSFAAPAYHLQLTGSRLSGSLTLAVHLFQISPPGAAATPVNPLLVYYDPASGGWRPAFSRYSASTQTLTASIPHLSTWSVLRLSAPKIHAKQNGSLSAFFSPANAATPTCPGAGQLTARGISVTADHGNLVTWCAGISGAGAAVLRVSSNRSYPLETEYPASWTARSISPPDPIVTQIVSALPSLLSRLSGNPVLVIPAGDTAQFSVPAGSSGETLTLPSAQSMIIDGILYGVDTLAMTFSEIPGVSPATPTRLAQELQLAFQVKDCATQLDGLATSASFPGADAVGSIFRSAADITLGCLAQVPPAAFGASAASTVFVAGSINWLIDGIRQLLGSAQAAIDDATNAPGYQIRVISRTSTPAGGSAAALTGTWTGDYTCSQGLTGLRLTIQAITGGTLTAVFSFFAVPSNPGVPSGSYTMTGRYNATSESFRQGHWISQPAGYEMVDLSAGPPSHGDTLLGGTVTTAGCGSFSVHKTR
jgi:hypothetical protein